MKAKIAPKLNTYQVGETEDKSEVNSAQSNGREIFFKSWSG